MVDAERPAQRFAVYVPNRVEPLVLEAENWVFALGMALDLLDRAEWVSRLSCEIHPGGTVVAEDRVTGLGYVVQRLPVGGRSGAAREGARAEDGAQGATGGNPGDTARGATLR